MAFSILKLQIRAKVAKIAINPVENANYLYLATGTSDGGGSAMDIVIKIAPNVWVRLVLLLGIVLAMFFAAYGIAVGVQKMVAKKKG